MLFVVLQDMSDELIRIGSSRSRGLGKVTAQISEQGRNGRSAGFVVSSIRGSKATQEPDNELWGLGRWLGDESKSYGTRQDDALALSGPVESTVRGIRRERAFLGDHLRSSRVGFSRWGINERDTSGFSHHQWLMVSGFICETP